MCCSPGRFCGVGAAVKHQGHLLKLKQEIRVCCPVCQSPLREIKSPAGKESAAKRFLLQVGQMGLGAVSVWGRSSWLWWNRKVLWVVDQVGFNVFNGWSASPSLQSDPGPVLIRQRGVLNSLCALSPQLLNVSEDFSVPSLPSLLPGIPEPVS